MPDVQISNARRVVFTAMGLVVFWVLVLWEYWMAVHAVGHSVMTSVSGAGEFLGESRVAVDHSLAYASLLALIPSMFVVIAESNSPRVLFRPAILTAVALFFGSVLMIGALGLRDAEVNLALWMGDAPAIMEMDSVADDAVVEDTHIVSWPWLLLPLILTTAFVIYAAWRSAVRDARE